MIGQEQKQEHSKFIEKSINHLEALGFENIKADLPGYETPKTFTQKSSGLDVRADITAQKNGQKYLFDISLKSEETKMLKSKWLLLNTVARMRSNRFKVITTKGHYKFTDTMLRQVNLTSDDLLKI